jgi:uncharacterized protein (DUF433 family)
MITDQERARIFHSDPAILDGAPVFTGTVVPLERLAEWLERDYTLGEFIERFRTVERAQAVAFLRYATQLASAGVARGAS